MGGLLSLWLLPMETGSCGVEVLQLPREGVPDFNRTVVGGVLLRWRGWPQGLLLSGLLLLLLLLLLSFQLLLF